MTKKKFIITTVLLLTICMFLTTVSSKVFAASEDETITQGVYIDSIHVGGMTVTEAKQAVQDYVDDLKSKKITVDIDGKTENITLEELGFDYTANTYIEDSLSIGKTGNLIQRYKELKDIEKENLVYSLEFKLKDQKITEFVESKCSIYDVLAVNATITRQNGEFVYTDDTKGKKTDVTQTVAMIKTAVLDGWNQQDLMLAAVVVEDEPLYTKEMVEKCDTVLGSYSTTYTTSSADRAGNLANGAKLINNTVLYPGEVFSAYEVLTPFTIENGYFQAGAYANGKVVDSIGGGACQVTTTMYNAVLYSELEVVERANHSMTISYVDLSRDAAIAGTWKDFKFKNNTEAPIVIEAYTVDRTITFKIWGNETRDVQNRTVKYETVILEEKQPDKDVITEDPTKPITYKETTQSAHIGYVAELYKIVYENSVEVSRTRVNKSIYNASPRYITVGTMEEEEKTKDKPKKKDEDTKVDEVPVEEIPSEEIPSEDIQDEGSATDDNSVEEDDASGEQDTDNTDETVSLDDGV